MLFIYVMLFFVFYWFLIIIVYFSVIKESYAILYNNYIYLINISLIKFESWVVIKNNALIFATVKINLAYQ